MKNLFLLVAIVAIALPSCKKIEESINALDNRLDKLEQEAIPSIDEQIAAINVSLENLDAMDTELNGYIDGLQATADNLQEQINATNTKIDNVKAELQGEISTAKAEVLAQLEALETELKNELAQINATIKTLQDRDAELYGKISDLRTYVDTELGKTTDWANATFATLTQYNALVAEVSTIKAQIEAINKSIADLETRLTTKINEDLAAAVSTLNSTIQQKVLEITTAYTNAIATAKSDITAAYTAAIQSAISNLETSMKQWVGQQLSNYYTIAEVDALLATLKTDLESQMETQKTYLEGLISSLSETTTAKIAENKSLIDALRADLTEAQADIATNSEKISENATQIIANAKAIAENSDDIEANNELIKANKSLIEENAALIASNKTAIATLGTSVNKNTAAIAENATKIAQNADLIAQNATAITNNAAAIANNATEIANLKTSLETTAAEITAAYKEAIKNAIATLNGELRDTIATEVATINTRIDNEVAAINSAITAITNRIVAIESEIESIKQQIADILGVIEDIKDNISALLARIQSVSYIPTHSDGKATVKYIGTTSQVTLNFEISPKDAVAELAKVWQDAVTLKAVYTETRAVSFVDMPIASFEADAENGIITVTASGENLSEEFFAGTQEASVRLAISDGNSSIVSNFIPVIAEPFAYDPVTNTLTVRTIDDMNLIASYPTASVVLEKTINMSEIDWTPINEFSGNFNGNSDKGSEIKNLSAPLFDTVTGQINNTKISVDITDITENYTGALACTLDGTINNCDVSGKIEVLEMKAQSSSSIHIAGAVGRLLTNATISNVTNNCNVTIRSTEAIETSMDIGGVTSYVSGSNITIKDCCNNGDLTFDVITSTAKIRNLYIGGITAYMPSSVSLTICGNVVNNGDIIFTGNTGVLHMGGVSARFQNIVTFSEGCTIGNGGTLTKSGTTKTANVGGVVGWNSSQDVTIAGNIINIGDINIDDTSSTSLSIGGIVGKTVTSVVGAMCYCKINAIGLQGKVGMIAGVTTMASNCAIGGSLVFEQELVEGDFYEEIIKNIETVLTYENYLNYVYASSEATVDECSFLTAKPTMPTI